MFGRWSLGTIGTSVGGVLTLLGFWAYFQDNATLNLAGFFYGIPVLLGGLALKSSELEPTPFSQPTSADVLALRDREATDTQTQIRKDVTRYRYGQEVHLETALEKLGLSPDDETRPTLTAIREEARNDHYSLILQFASTLLPLETWQEKQDKMTRFFGPQIRIELAQPSDAVVEVAIIAEPEAA
ncbi:MAG: DUF2854 domain-containing protein [Cyanobacteria bacterium P01_H01_bin.121]